MNNERVNLLPSESTKVSTFASLRTVGVVLGKGFHTIITNLVVCPTEGDNVSHGCNPHFRSMAFIFYSRNMRTKNQVDRFFEGDVHVRA